MLTKQKLFNTYNELVDKINSDFSQGQLSQKEYQQESESLQAEFNHYLNELNTSEYNESEDTAEFNALGEVLLEVAENAGYEDLEQYVYDLADSLQLDPEDVVTLMTDEDVDENTSYAVLDSIGLLDDSEDEDESEEDIYEEPVYEDEEVNEDEASYRIAELEDTIANFQLQSLTLNAINKQENRALNLVEEGHLPPAAYQMLFLKRDGSDLEDDEKVAAFSQLAEKNNIDLTAHLYGQELVLDVFEKLGLGNTGLFSQLIEDEVSEFNADEDTLLDLEVERSFKYNKNRN